MTDLIKETDEALRQERLIGLLKRYRILLIAVFVVAIGAVAVYQYQNFRHEQFIEKVATSFLTIQPKLQATDDISEAEKLAVDELLDGSTGYALATHFELAHYYLQRQDLNSALEVYQQIASSDNWDMTYRSYAELQVLILAYQMDKSYDQFRKDIESFINTNDEGYKTWVSSASIWATEVALATNNEEDAKHWLEMLTNDPTTPPQWRRDTSIVLQSLASHNLSR